VDSLCIVTSVTINFHLTGHFPCQCK